MKTMTKFSAVVASAAATALFGAGIASAAVTIGLPGSAATVTPTTNYTMCGTVFVGASDVTAGNPLPLGARAVQGATVTGTLINVIGGVSGGPYVATTGANGSYCFTGDSTMSTVIGFGGKVTVAVSPTSIVDSTVTPAKTLNAKLPYAGTIKTGQFLSHKVSGLDSAERLNIAFE
ncbi:hypothetical protein B2J88_29490 [Rhodococcus sp. SRB_17]|nr:hypothetical protein [Rhodococcus sp. SRB_17]